jgi:uncharacterized protein YjiS (DUF1127 family)
MNASIARDQLSFSLGNLSYIGPSYEEVAPAVEKPSNRLGTWVARLVAALAEWRQRRVVMHELAMMSDRELSDIGLTRSDLGRVFDPAFAAEHARGRDYIAY